MEKRETKVNAEQVCLLKETKSYLSLLRKQANISDGWLISRLLNREVSFLKIPFINVI